MLIEDFNYTINTWIHTIEQYCFKQLCMQPGVNDWSLGQVCMHLLKDTNWYVKQIAICLLNDDNANENMTAFAQDIFQHNAFPDEKLINPANANMMQPISKEALMQSFLKLKKDMNEISVQIESSKLKGKTKHPGLGYFNAIEWLQFSEMHLRHHLKQKERIEKFLQAY